MNDDDIAANDRPRIRGPLNTLPADDFLTPCWRVVNLSLCESERVTQDDGSRAWHPDMWLWFAWAPAHSWMQIGNTPPTRLGISVGSPYDDVLELVGAEPIRVLAPGTLRESVLLQSALDSDQLQWCCRARVSARLEEARFRRPASDGGTT